MKIVIGVLCCMIFYGCASTSEQKVINNPLPNVQEASVDIVWTQQLAERGHDRYAKLWPAIYKDALVVADPNGNVVKLDANTGQPIWRRQYAANFSSGPTVSAEHILLGTLNAEVYLLSMQTGNVLWRTLVSSEVLAPPQLSNEMLVVQANDGKLAGLQVKDGKQIWVYDRQVPVLSLRGTTAPLLIDDKAITGFANGKLVAISLGDGKLLWETTIAVPKGRSELERMVDIDGQIEVVDGILYVVSFRGRVAAVEVATGNLLWTRDMSSYNGMVVSTDLLFLLDSKGRVWALNRADGATLWMQEKLSGLILTNPTVVGDKVFVGDKYGNFYRLSRTTGRVLDVVSYEKLAYLANVKTVVDDIDGVDSLMGRESIVTSVLAPIQYHRNHVVVAYQSGLLLSLSLSP